MKKSEDLRVNLLSCIFSVHKIKVLIFGFVMNEDELVFRDASQDGRGVGEGVSAPAEAGHGAPDLGRLVRWHFVACVVVLRD